MRSLFNPAAAQHVRTRLAVLTPEHQPCWGRMNAKQMLVHVAQQLRMALGELRPKPVPAGAIGHWPMKQLVIYVLPSPKGAPTAPELLECDPREWSRDRESLEELIDRMSRAGPETTFAPHPAFGKLSVRAWGVLSYRHLDHHFRQFGI